MSDKIGTRVINTQSLLVRAATEIRIDGAIHPDTRQRLYDFGYTAADVERAVTNINQREAA
jgi:hypothetical protein